MECLHPLMEDQYFAALADACADSLQSVLAKAQRGHCMRIDDLPLPVMEQLCAKLSAEVPEVDARLVGATAGTEPWRITATKAIELRNLEQKPLLLFVPATERTAAEDSFGESTFTQIRLSSALDHLTERLLANMGPTREGIRKVLDFASRFMRCSQDQLVRYLLTAASNGGTDLAAGLALYELDLIPDAALLRSNQLLARLQQHNRASVEALTDSALPLTGRIASLKLREERRTGVDRPLFNLLSNREGAPVRVWGQEIASKAEWRPLSLDHWPFLDELADDHNLQVHLYLPSLPVSDEGLPQVELNRVAEKGLKLTWETNPPAYQVEALDHFVIELITSEGSTVYATKKIKKSKGRSLKQSKDLKEIAGEALGLPDGVFYFRIGAFSKEGQQLNLDEEAREEATGSSRLTSDTPDLWVYRRDEEESDPVEDERFTRVTSFGEAYVLGRSTYLRQRDSDEFPELAVVERTEEGKRVVQFALRFGEDYAYTLSVSRALAEVQREIFRQPGYLGAWLLDFTRCRPDDVQVARGVDPAPAHGELAAFRRERGRIFRLFESSGMVVESADLRSWADEIEAYAAAYHRLLQKMPSEAESGQMAAWMAHDQVEVRVPGALPGDVQTIYLLSPTHPLRLLWTLQYQLVVKDWLQERAGARVSPKSLTYAVRLMRHELRPSQLPPVLVAGGTTGKYYAEVGQVTSLWSVYAPVGLTSDRGLLLNLAHRLGVKGLEQSYDERISAVQLEQRFARFIVQHPYVNPLVINAVHPGEGRDLVGALLGLSKRFPHLRYKVNLFGAATRFDELGTAFEELLDPTRSTSEVTDEFSDASSLLVPKLVYTRIDARKLQEGVRSGPRFAAHITVLYNPFPVDVGLREQLQEGQGRSSFVHGLTQTLVTTWNEADGDVAWRRQLVPTDSPDVETGYGYPALLSQVLQVWGEAMGTVLAGRHSPQEVPALVLKLEGQERSMLRGVHELSTWVVTVDRHLGIEFFDQQEDTYLLDFAPEYTGFHAERIMLTTNSVDEVQDLLYRVFDELELEQNVSLSNAVLRALRALSGRLPMALSSSAPTRRKEVVGLALARFYLTQLEQLERCIVIPLDAHRNWFTDQQGNGENGQRGDLLLAYLDPDQSSVHFRLVEVKVRTSLTGAGAYQQLREEIRSQLENTEEMLRRRYDPSEPRVGWSVQAKELTDILRFYMERAVRYETLPGDLVPGFGKLLDRLDSGFELTFDRWALVFDLENPGEETLTEGGMVYCRVGREEARSLVKAAIEEEETRSRYTAAPATGPKPRKARRDPSTERVRSEFEQTLPPSYRTREPEEMLPPEPEPPPDPGPGSGAPPVVEAGAGPDYAGNQPEPVTASVGNSEPEAPQAAEVVTVQPPEITLGETYLTKQWGVLGQVGGKRFAIDLDGCNTISLFGVQGGGKSYTLGSMIEMASVPIPGINSLPRPLATVVFHYNESQEYEPEFVSMINPNDEEKQLEILRDRYGAEPARLSDLVLLAPPDKVEARAREFPGIQVAPIAFHSSELSAGDWRFLMGVGENQAMYIKQLTLLMRSMRDRISLSGLRDGIENSSMAKQHRELALMRLQFAEQFIDDSYRLGDWLEPGRLIIIDLRDELVDQDEALGLFVVMLNIFASVKRDGAHFNKLIAFDEAHKYMGNSQMVEQITSTIRQMRHQGVSVLIASQDPPSLPVQVIELSSLLVMHKFNSPNWLKHIQKAVQPLSNLTPDHMSSLAPGEAYIWANKSTDQSFSRMAVKVKCRPRVTKHGGATKRATD